MADKQYWLRCCNSGALADTIVDVAEQDGVLEAMPGSVIRSAVFDDASPPRQRGTFTAGNVYTPPADDCCLRVEWKTGEESGDQAQDQGLWQMQAGAPRVAKLVVRKYNETTKSYATGETDTDTIYVEVLGGAYPNEGKIDLVAGVAEIHFEPAIGHKGLQTIMVASLNNLLGIAKERILFY